MKQVSRGFTLPELMVVLAIAGVILGIGAPNFNRFRANSRLTGAANDFLTSIQSARTEAVKRGIPVAMCPSSAPDDADAECSALADAEGWIVFADPNNDCLRDATVDEEELLRGEWFGNDAVRIDSSGTCISFAATGFLQPEAITGVPSARNTLFCDVRGKATQEGTTLSAARGVLIGQTGRARVTRDITSGADNPNDLTNDAWPDCPE
jgi:type IV fimbrial biogenesis protein FimT